MSRATSRHRCRLGALALGVAVSLGSGQDAWASGYAVKEQSGRMLGSAFAGAGSAAQDPSVLFFNPAGIARLDGYRISGLGSGIFVRTRFDDDASVLLPPGLPIPGGNGGDTGKDALVPAVYATAAPIEFLHLGIGVNAPFGLSSTRAGGSAATTRSSRHCGRSTSSPSSR